MKKVNRPVRLSTFVTNVVLIEDFDEAKNNPTIPYGEFLKKSDVHYCAEKDAIDIVSYKIENQVPNEYVYIIYKRDKKTDKYQYISAVYEDEDTKQVVID